MKEMGIPSILTPFFTFGSPMFER